MKAIVLTDNTGNNNLPGEWGLSVYIEFEGKNILLDTGKSDLFNRNAETLGIDLSNVDVGILSHAHYDHSDGMSAFFRINSKAKFYLQRGSAENCYKKIMLYKKYIGIKKNTLDTYKDRIEYVSGKFELYDNVFLVSHSMPDLEKVGKREKMLVKNGRKWSTDTFAHEQSLVFVTEKGLIVFNSCSHAGASGIVDEVADAFPSQKVYAYIGGFHLYNKTDDEIKEFAQKVKKAEIEYICTGHCTGGHAYEILKNEIGDTVHGLRTGLTIEI